MLNPPDFVPVITGYLPAIGFAAGSIAVTATVLPATRYIRADKDVRRSIRRAYVIRRGWASLATMSGLTVTKEPSQLSMAASQLGEKQQQPKARKIYPAIKTRPDRFGFTVTARTLPKVGLTQWQAAEEDLRNGWRVERVKITQPKPGLVAVRAFMREPLEAVVHSGLVDQTGKLHVKPGSLRANSEILLGHTEDGEPVTINLATGSHGAIQGVTRSGKSNTANTIFAHAALMPDVRMVIVDPNLGSVAPWWRTAHTVSASSSPEEACTVLEELRAEMERRQGIFWAARTDKLVDFTPEMPLILLAVDEVSNFTNWPDRKLADRFRMLLQAVTSQGHKFGIRVWLLGQKLEANVLNTATRTNLTSRICHRVDTVEDYLHMFPDGRHLEVTAAERSMPEGVGIASVPGLVTPSRMRSVYLPAEHCWAIADAIVEVSGEVRPLPAPKLTLAKEAALRAA
ncbi:FtsK/SpoIIIE domain-containing protein [Kitasatospora sp. NPDC101235]|uniref:FtsK/SpoIIIE domain-containing protein n=1 Tax=Kitasatospora sp. NPDC101235 TaxID=3364101 RepID=UPI0038223453